MVRVNAAEMLALAALGVWAGARIHAFLPALDRLLIPRPITGGLLGAVLVAALRSAGVEVEFDTVLRDLFVLIFFTTIGLQASAGLLRREGGMVLICLALAVAGAKLQNLVGVGMAAMLGLHPLTGIVAGATTLAGGPATALAFGPYFEEQGLADAQVLGLACAVFGIIAAGLIGGPAGGWLIRRHNLVPHVEKPNGDSSLKKGDWLYTLATLTICLGIGSVLSRGIAALGATLPPYIGAMIVAAVARFLDDRSRRRLDEPLLEQTARLSLGLFIVMALVTLKLWVLVTMAVPLLIIMVAQVIVTVLFAVFVAYRWLGKDYEAAVATAGWTGFMLGTTANAVAAMEALEAQHGAAPRARLAVPVVGAFLIDFTNSFLILAGADFVKRVLVN